MKFKKTVSLLAALTLIAGMFSAVFSFNASAVSYRGSGTPSDPFLVTSAEQLQGMRDNLSASYKLANNIDLSGMDFKPIGRLDSPFTGSFICELNADNSPKYAIRNLSMTVAETPYVAENKSKWEGGLFGATSGATISGIVIFDVNVTNNNIGEDTGSVIYNNYNPGMGEQCTGALVGSASGGSISYCGATGNVGGKSNYTAGLVGYAKEGISISNCFFIGTVNITGKWGTAGFVGGTNSASLEYCYFSGNSTGGRYGSAAFSGGVGNNSSYNYCASEGSADQQFLRPEPNGQESCVFSLSNCASASKETCSENTTLAITDYVKITVTDCYYSSAQGAFQTRFVDDDGKTTEILNAVKAQVAYTVNVSNYLADSPEGGAAANSSTDSNISGGSSTVVSEGQTSSVAAVSSEELVKMIEALPNPEDEMVFTIDYKDDVKAAWSAYSALSVGEQEDLDAQLVSKLLVARKQMSLLMARDFVEALEELPEAKDLTADDIDNILALYDDYKFLDDSVVSEIDEALIAKLEAAYEFAQSNGETGTGASYVDSALTTAEWVIVIVCGVFILLSVAFHVFAAIYQFKKNKSLRFEQLGADIDE